MEDKVSKQTNITDNSNNGNIHISGSNNFINDINIIKNSSCFQENPIKN